MKKVLITLLSMLALNVSAQDLNQKAFDDALHDYKIYKTKSKFSTLVESTKFTNERDIELIKDLNKNLNASNLDQIYDLIEGIQKRNSILVKYDSKFKPVVHNELEDIISNLSSIFYKVGETYNKSSSKADAIVSYKALKKAKFLNPKLDVTTLLNEAITKGQTKVSFTFKEQKNSKSNYKLLKEIIEKDNDKLIVLVDKKEKSDVEIKLDLKNMNQQSFVTTHLRNGGVVNDVIHNSSDIQFNGTKGFGVVSTGNFSMALLESFNKALGQSNVNYLELKNIVSYDADLVVQDKVIKLSNTISDNQLFTTANIKSSVWSDIIITDEANNKLILNNIYDSIKNNLPIDL